MSRECYRLCEFCKVIPFQDLPSEDEEGFPHQPSLEALKASAAVCALCYLILDAVFSLRKRIEDEGNAGTVAEVQDYYGRPREMPSGRTVMEIVSLGAYYPGSHAMVTSRPAAGGGKPVSVQSGYAFADDTSIRPWLFGNWWKADDSGSQLQLIGLGIRLAATPNMEDAEGNCFELRCDSNTVLPPSIVYRGSYLRIRTDDGKLEDIYIFHQ